MVVSSYISVLGIVQARTGEREMRIIRSDIIISNKYNDNTILVVISYHLHLRKHCESMQDLQA